MQMILAIFVATITLASSAYASNIPERFTIVTVSGIRDFYLYAQAQKPRGLIVMLHGCKTTAAEFNATTGMSEFATAKGYAVLYPEQSPFSNLDRCWNWFWGSETPIIAEGIREVQARFNLNREQTYLMGMSAGAAQGAILANCNRNLISGVLLHSGLQYLAATNPFDANTALEQGSFTSAVQAARAGLRCNKSLAPISFMVVHGDQDQRVKPINASQSTEELLLLNQLLATNAKQPAVISASTTGGQTDYTLDGKAIGSLLLIHGLAHQWAPGVIEKFFEKMP